jgi:hypothetical protein
MAPLPVGATVAVDVAFDGGDWTGVSVLSTTGTTAPLEPLYARDVPVEQAEVRLTLTRGTDTTTGASVLRATTKALVSPARAEQIVVPIILDEQVMVDADEGRQRRQDTAAEFRFLHGLANAGTIVTYQEGQETWSVTVEKVAHRPKSWTDKRNWLNGLCFVTLRTIS